MSIQPRRPQLDSLRDMLGKMEADSETNTPHLSDLKRILRARISELEAAQRLTSGEAITPHCSLQNYPPVPHTIEHQ